MSADPIAVRGGAGGNIAMMEDLDALALKLDLAADQAAEAEAAGRTAADHIRTGQGDAGFPQLKLPSSYLLPGVSEAAWEEHQAATRRVMAEAEAEVDEFLTAAQMGQLQADLTELASRLRTAKSGYEDAERQAADWLSQLSTMRAAALNAPFAGGWLGWLAAAFGRSIVGGGATYASLKRKLGREPSLAELLRAHHPEIRALLGKILVSPFLPVTPTTSTLTRRLGKVGDILTLLMRDSIGEIEVTRGQTRRTTAPTGVGDVASRIVALGRSRPEDAHKVAISKVVATDGSVSWLVTIPGTMTTTLGWDPSIADLGTNFDAVAGDINPVHAAVMAAMSDAGVKQGQPVVLAGHSQGGIVSAELAAHPDFNKAYSVAGVLTMGSPVSELKPPKGQQWLSIEHAQDPVPALAPANGGTPGHTTVTRDLATASDPKIRAGMKEMGVAHTGPTYVDTARLVDQNGNYSVRRWREAVAPVFDPRATVTTTEYEAKRVFKD
ncbi:MAG: alpha/beta fold hydrolase [Bifidobacteriaceae bacterium]|nr:alpha/beta fold hydrolase [Bifidobacteriaceae bacterium]